MNREEDSRVAIEAAKGVLSEVMEGLKKHCSLFLYRAFVRLVHVIAVKENQSGGFSALKIRNNAVKAYLESDSERQEFGYQLLFMLGFTSDPEDGGYHVEHYRSSEAVLKAFTEMTFRDLFVHSVDPLARETLQPNTHLAFHVVYLCYHVYIEIILLLLVHDRVLPFAGSRLFFSFEAIEAAAKRLNVMQQQPSPPPPGASNTRSTWDELKVKIIRFVYAKEKTGGREEIGSSLENVAIQLRTVLEPVIPQPLTAVWKFIYALASVIASGYTNDLYFMFNAVKAKLYNQFAEQMNHGFFNEEFVESVQVVREMMMAVDQLTGTRLDQIHRLLIWQAENLLTCFKPDFVDDFGTEEQRRQSALCQCLKDVETAVGNTEYRAYAKALCDNVVQAVDSAGSLAICNLKSTRGFAKLKTVTEAAEKSLYLLGYEDVKPSLAQVIPGTMLLRNYDRNKPILEFFLGYAKASGAAVLTRGDPARHRPIETIDDTPTLIAYLTYHLRARVYLLALYTPDYMLRAVQPDVEQSLAAIDAAAVKMEIAKPESNLRQTWNGFKQQIVKYLRKGGGEDDRHLISVQVEELGDGFLREMPDVPASCLMIFMQNLSIFITLTAREMMLDDSDTDSYLRQGEGLNVEAFSDEFVAVSRDILELVRNSKERKLDSREVERAYRLSTWQSDNFLSHFIADGFAKKVGRSFSDLFSRFLARESGLSLTAGSSSSPSTVETVGSVPGTESDDSDDSAKMNEEKAGIGGDTKEEELADNGQIESEKNQVEALDSDRETPGSADDLRIEVRTLPLNGEATDQWESAGTLESLQLEVDKLRERLTLTELELRQLGDALAGATAKIIRDAMADAIDTKRREECDLISQLMLCQSRLDEKLRCTNCLNDMESCEVAGLLKATLSFCMLSSRRDLTELSRLSSDIWNVEKFLNERIASQAKLLEN